jgi:predicted aminopeptidase
MVWGVHQHFALRGTGVEKAIGQGFKMKWRIAILCSLAALLASCAQLGYYVQAAHGQFSLLSDAKPIDEWLADPSTGPKLRNQLRKVQEIRRFAAQELGLPDNGSFKTYKDLKRPFVLWNVVATPELSLRPEHWCFPIAGCVNYRGYYNKDDALSFAKQLHSKGFEVQVGGVLAYSTLGWFDDPVLSTFIYHPDSELARLVFHELAHQMVYVPGDSQFNESFATTVEEAGVERWLAVHGNDEMRKTHLAYRERKQDFLTLLQKYRNELEWNYARKASDTDKRKEKAAIFKALKGDYQTLKEAKWAGYPGYDRWFAGPLSNAHLASVATYQDFVPSFRSLLEQEKTLPRFYQAVKALAVLDRELRNMRLAQLANPVQFATYPAPANASLLAK